MKKAAAFRQLSRHQLRSNMDVLVAVLPNPSHPLPTVSLQEGKTSVTQREGKQPSVLRRGYTIAQVIPIICLYVNGCLLSRPWFWPEGSHIGPRPKAVGHYGCPKLISRSYYYKKPLTYLLIGS